MPKQLTIRGVSDDLGRRLARLGQAPGQSVNSLALGILENAVGVAARRQHLRRYATWEPDELARFDRSLADQRVIDGSLWQ